MFQPVGGHLQSIKAHNRKHKKKNTTTKHSENEPIPYITPSTFKKYFPITLLFIKVMNFRISYCHTYCNVLTFYIDIYTVTSKEWDLSLPIQNDFATVSFISCTLKAQR
jgi:hypothetical protein